MGADQKNAADRHASLIFTDESGLLLLPLVRRTLAPRGCTPVLEHRARHRDKVSVAAALSLSPERCHVSLYYQTFPKGQVTSETYARFLRHAPLRHIGGPVILLHDGGSVHKGEPLRELMAGYPRLQIEPLPPYAPELNPVEQLWNFEKDKQLSNFVPHDVAELDVTLSRDLDHMRHDQLRLRSFFRATPLPWGRLTRFF